MKFLLDENQSPRIADHLADAGHDAVHVRDVDLRTSPDDEVLAIAHEAGRVIISADTDFSELLATSNAGGPSILLLRRQEQRRADEIAALILGEPRRRCRRPPVGYRGRPRRRAHPDPEPPAPARLTSRFAALEAARSCCPVHGDSRNPC